MKTEYFVTYDSRSHVHSALRTCMQSAIILFMLFTPCMSMCEFYVGPFDVFCIINMIQYCFEIVHFMIIIANQHRSIKNKAVFFIVSLLTCSHHRLAAVNEIEHVEIMLLLLTCSNQVNFRYLF